MNGAALPPRTVPALQRVARTSGSAYLTLSPSGMRTPDLLATTSSACASQQTANGRGGFDVHPPTTATAQMLMMSTSSGGIQVSLRDEQVRDRLFGTLVECLSALFSMNCLQSMAQQIVEAYDVLLEEHYNSPETSRLRDLVPGVGKFWTPLPFSKAWAIYDEKYRITHRRHVPPTYHEIRHIMNIAQVISLRSTLRLITFDGDETLYPDRQCFSDAQTAAYITTLLKQGVNVAVVTAAGYGYQAEKYEERLRGLLDYWKDNQVPTEVVKRFFLFGGESNYLLTTNSEYRLEGVLEGLWRAHQSEYMKAFFREESRLRGASQVHSLLDIAESIFHECIEELHLRCAVIRKERAVGIVPGGENGRRKFPVGSGMKTLRPEILEEVCLRVRRAIALAQPPFDIPYCAFNGGHDVWVDVGNKAEGIKTLQSFLNVPASGCVHVGDQFLLTGNDLAARDVCPTLWIVNPEETNAVLRSLLKQMADVRRVGPSDSFGSTNDCLASEDDDDDDDDAAAAAAASSPASREVDYDAATSKSIAD